MSDEDKSLFAEAMSDVIPLKELKQTLATEKPKKASNPSFGKIRRKYQQLEQQSQTHFRFNPAKVSKNVSAMQSMLYQQNNVRAKEMELLKQSQIRLADIIDLHGLTILEAEKKLVQFLNEAINHKFKYVRIIHGKGYNSSDEHPALKNLTNQMLRQCDYVIAFCSTPEKDGGVGAVNVMLRMID